MQLSVVAPTHVDRAWKDGASCLAEACETSGGEITGDQLKMILARGERTLVALMENDKPVGWGCWRIDQLPNVRVLHITDLVAHGAQFERFFVELKNIADMLGCSEIRCSCKPAQARLYQMKCGFEPVYTTLRVTV
ncbi:MAG: hypothetical protein ACYCZR_03735 [Burkholderiales bacterium]